MTKISDYDEFDYDYKKYWQNREYEDKAEKIVLNKYLKEGKYRYFLDIGGSFGRNLEVSCPLSETPIILDYSLKTLKKNKNSMQKRCPNVRLIASNAYHLPFKNSSLDASILVRVLHHIENQEGLFREIERVLKNHGMFVLEYANKIHLKARIKWFLTMQFSQFSTLPYQQPTKGSFEGVKKGEEAIFLNYHPKYIKEMLKNTGFRIIKNTNCSFLRFNFFKKLFPLKLLLFLEKFLQNTISWKNIAPSIVLKTQKVRQEQEYDYETFEDILCCPNCKKDLKFENTKAFCKDCDKIFKKEDDIWDFRI